MEWDPELGPGELPALEVERSIRICSPTPRVRPGDPRARCTCRGSFLVSIARRRRTVRGPRRPTASSSHRHGLDHGSLDGGRRRRARACVVYMEGATRLAEDRLWRTVEEERVTMLASFPYSRRALIPKATPKPTSRRCGDHDHRRAMERRSVRLAERARRGGGGIPIIISPVVPRWVRASSPSRRWRPRSPSRSASGTWPGDGGLLP